METLHELDQTGCAIIYIGFVAIIAAYWALTAWCLEFLWNWIIVSIFHAPSVNYAQAAGLALVLFFLKQVLATVSSK